MNAGPRNPFPHPPFGVRWVHVFEEDAAGKAVFLPDTADIPLSRRPRMQFELSQDGSATLYVPDARDALAPKPAVWHEEDRTLVVRARGEPDGMAIRVLECTADRLLAQLVSD